MSCAGTRRCRGRPVHGAAEGALEVADRPHRDRVDHLLPELRVAVGRRQPVLREEVRIVEVDRRMQRLASLVLVDDRDVFARRPGLELLPGDAQRRLVHHRRLEARGRAGIDSEDAQAAEDGLRNDCRPTGIER